MKQLLLLTFVSLALGACGGSASTTARTLTETQTAAATVATTAAAHAAAIPAGDWLQFNYDAQRSGTGPANTGINAGNLGKLRRQIISLPGTVDSSVIELHDVTVNGRAHDVLIMTTTYGRTLALDARTGRRLWEYTPPDIGSYAGSAQITTATPTADPDRQYVYATSPNGIVHKLTISSGRQVWARSVTFDPGHEKLASPPTISGKLVVVVTDGYDGDAPPYIGHVATINRQTGRIVHVFNTLCSDRHHLTHASTCGASDSAIFGRAGAVVVPGSNDMLVATGNAPFNGHTDWGDSVLELSPDASRLRHNYTPTNQAFLNSNDVDLGSTSPAILPDPGGPPLALQGGKDGLLKLLNLDRLDGTSGSAGPRTGGQLQELDDPGTNQLFTAPMVWVHRGHTYVFVGDGSGTAEYVLHAGRHPRLSKGWSDGTGGTSPVLAGGLLYVYNPGGDLVVRQPLSGHVLATLPAEGGHWNSPIVVAGRIALPVGNANDHATSGKLYVWRLPGA